MAYDPDFNLDEVLRTLGTVASRYQDGSPEDQALRVAAVGLYFIRDLDKLDQYRAFFRDFYTPAARAVTVGRSFRTKEEANAWLPSATAGEIVSVGGLAHVVAKGPDGLMLVRTYLPGELDEMK
jgi:hypothetical protein